MMKALKGIFSPGASRHSAKCGRYEDDLINGIDTMRWKSADVHQFARFVRVHWPAVHRLGQVTPAMASAYIAELIRNERSGGRPRQVNFLPEYHDFLGGLCQKAESNPTGHLFHDRRALAERARAQVRQVCEQEGIPCLGTHGFRKTFAVDVYERNRAAGLVDLQALVETSRQLGHNRAVVTSQSYVAPNHRHPKEDK